MTIEWLEPWESIKNYKPEAFEKELYREVGKQHILYGKQVIALGKRCDRDVFLFEIKDADFCFAVVHLTFSIKTEANPHYPNTKIYKDLDAWIKDMMIDHTEYTY